MQTKATLGHLVKAYQQLFAGATDRYGVYSGGDRYSSISSPLSLAMYEQHLLGKTSLAIVLINKENKCKAGVIDFDDHKKWGIKKKFDYELLLKKIKLFNFPLSVVTSKTGGAHAWLFLDQFYPAHAVIHILKKFAYQLVGHTNIELFPRQERLGSKDFGSLINLPYQSNSRQLLDLDGKVLNVEEMLKIAPSRVRTLKELETFKLLAKDKFPEGRNNMSFSATAYLKKHFPNEWREKIKEHNKLFHADHPKGVLSDRELEQTVISSNEKKDYFDGELKEAPPTELVGYDYADYRIRTDIIKPVMLVDDLLIEGSMNFEFGQKGVGKSEFIIGLANAIARGVDFLQFGISKAHPVVYLDAEMHPYDTIARNEPYYKNYSKDPAKNYLHVLNWNDQKDRHFPDIQHEVGQNLIQKYLEKVESLTGKKPIFILDNLRSASGYEENNSDSWRPIGLWLKKLSHGLNYTLIVVDHSGKSVELEMRGTSAKADHANLCLQILSEKRKGGLMRIKVKYAKARGLRPDQTADFVAQYDFAGNWHIAQSDKEQEDEALKKELKKLLPKNWTQKAMAKEIDISVGRVNKLIKEIEKEKM